jgi:hypothetical protein
MVLCPSEIPNVHLLYCEPYNVERPPLWSSGLGYRSGGPGSIPGTIRKINVVGLERGALSLVSTTEELLDRKVAAPV